MKRGIMNTTPNAQPLNACGRQEEIITYLYDEASAAERAAFEQHLDACAACRQELRALERVRHDLSAWQLPLTPPLEIAPPRSSLTLLRELLGSLSVWPKVILGASAMAAAAVVVLALIGTSISFGQGGFSMDFGKVAKQNAPTAPTATLTRAEAEALIQEATTRARTEAQAETRMQLASLEERLSTAHQAELTKVSRRLYAEQRAMLAKANRQEQTLSEWLLTGQSREGGGTEDDKNK